jgi:hypothetical protein
MDSVKLLCSVQAGGAGFEHRHDLAEMPGGAAQAF